MLSLEVGNNGITFIIQKIAIESWSEKFMDFEHLSGNFEHSSTRDI